MPPAPPEPAVAPPEPPLPAVLVEVVFASEAVALSEVEEPLSEVEVVLAAPLPPTVEEPQATAANPAPSQTRFRLMG